MLRSLRFRLPALFLAGIAAAGIVSVAIAFQLLSNYSRSQSLKELRREAAGLNQLLSEQAIQVVEKGASAPAIEPPQLENATGDRIYYFGVPPFPGEGNGLAGLRPLPQDARTKIDVFSISRCKIFEQFDLVTAWRLYNCELDLGSCDSGNFFRQSASLMRGM